MVTRANLTEVQKFPDGSYFEDKGFLIWGHVSREIKLDEVSETVVNKSALPDTTQDPGLISRLPFYSITYVQSYDPTVSNIKITSLRNFISALTTPNNTAAYHIFPNTIAPFSEGFIDFSLRNFKNTDVRIGAIKEVEPVWDSSDNVHITQDLTSEEIEIYKEGLHRDPTYLDPNNPIGRLQLGKAVRKFVRDSLPTKVKVINKDLSEYNFHENAEFNVSYDIVLTPQAEFGGWESIPGDTVVDKIEYWAKKDIYDTAVDQGGPRYRNRPKFEKLLSTLYKHRSDMEKYTYVDANGTAYIPTFFLNGYSSTDLKNLIGQNSDSIFGEDGKTLDQQQREAREKKEKQQKERERIAKLRQSMKVSEQAILLHNLKELSQESIKAREESQYNNFACIDVRDANNISDFATMLTTQKDAASIFEKLKPVHIASMLPVVRVFGYPDDTRRTSYEYEFEEFADLSSSNTLLGTSTGVNLTSFSWNFRGETPFLADKSIDCDMSIRAQSVDDLEKKYFYGKNRTEHYKFSNLFLPFDSEEKTRSTETSEVSFEPRKTRTRVKVQYKIDEKSPIWKADPELANAIKKMTVELELQLVHHSIELNQDGTMKINVRFIGRYDAETKDSGTANTTKSQLPTTPTSDTSSANKDNTKKIKSLERQLKRLQSSDAALDSVTRNRISALQEKINQLRNSPPSVDTSEFDIKRPFLELFKKIYTKRGLNVAEVELETLAIKGDQKKVATEKSEQQEVTELTTTQKAAEFLAKKKEKLSKIKIDESYSSPTVNIKYLFLGDIMEAAMESYIENANLPEYEAQDVRDTRVILGPLQFQKNFYDTSTGKGFQITYNRQRGKLEFASKESQGLVDRIAEIKKLPKPLANSEEKELKEKTKLLEKLRTEQVMEKVICNLADLPISLNYFMDFLNKNFLEAGKDKLTLDEFVKTVVDQLVPRTLQYESENMLLPRVDSKIIRGTHSAYTNRSFPFADNLGFKMGYEDITKAIAPLWLPEFKKGKKRLFLEDLISSGKVPLVSHEEADGKNRCHMADYLFIYGEQMSYEKDFNKTQDHQDGIYHLEVGKDAGVVKEINFSVVDDQAFQSFVLQRALKEKENIRKRVYDAKVELQGITFFRPGQKVFLNPSAYGTARNLKAFGLLGYYTVITVENLVEEGQYKTSLDCKFHSWPKLRGER